ncbi:hypothetical protein ADEAN_000135700 [Angomonas deanei]|uniref:Uncharacterized protein n=1 Tax=Angomonas deanei TaxID=59799 RepID=A0A7G2C581_9TRYP|nr:hypothetical protein ADEAN_000135700 [Angomonas deanei]
MEVLQPLVSASCFNVIVDRCQTLFASGEENEEDRSCPSKALREYLQKRNNADGTQTTEYLFDILFFGEHAPFLQEYTTTDGKGSRDITTFPKMFFDWINVEEMEHNRVYNDELFWRYLPPFPLTKVFTLEDL